jgi:hypothetical protein
MSKRLEFSTGMRCPLGEQIMLPAAKDSKAKTPPGCNASGLRVYGLYLKYKKSLSTELENMDVDKLENKGAPVLSMKLKHNHDKMECIATAAMILLDIIYVHG